MLVIYYCVAVCNFIAIHYNVMFTIYGVHHFWSHIHQCKHSSVDYSILKPPNNRMCLLARMYTHQPPLVMAC